MTVEYALIAIERAARAYAYSVQVCEGFAGQRAAAASAAATAAAGVAWMALSREQRAAAHTEAERAGQWVMPV